MPQLTFKNTVIALFVLAVVFRAGLLVHVAAAAPDSLLLFDSRQYLDEAGHLTAYFKGEDAVLQHWMYRTPGYPLFLSLLNGLGGLPLPGVVLVQMLLNVAAAFLVYQTAALLKLGRRPSVLAGLIVLLDPPLVIYSSLILTESLCAVLLALFLYLFTLNLQRPRLRWILSAALALTAAVYVRPAGLYLGYAAAGFVVYALIRQGQGRLAVAQALVLLCVVYGLVGLWSHRNAQRFGVNKFSNIDNATLKEHGWLGSYERRRDAGDDPALPPAVFYPVELARHTLTMLTDPGNFKYFHSKPLTVIGKIYGYLFVVFWLTGVAGAIRPSWRRVDVQFLWLLVLYFTFGTVVAITDGASARFRVPMLPALAVIAALGWSRLCRPGGWLARRYSVRRGNP